MKWWDAFTHADEAKAMLRTVRQQRRPWRGELSFKAAGSASVPVGVRADLVVGAQDTVLGFIFIFTDLTEIKRTEEARRELDQALYQAGRVDSLAREASGLEASDEVMAAILANARMAALDIADGGGGASIAPLIEELRIATQRAATIYARLRAHAGSRDE